MEFLLRPVKSRLGLALNAVNKSKAPVAGVFCFGMWLVDLHLKKHALELEEKLEAAILAIESLHYSITYSGGGAPESMSDFIIAHRKELDLIRQKFAAERLREEMNNPPSRTDSAFIIPVAPWLF